MAQTSQSPKAPSPRGATGRIGSLKLAPVKTASAVKVTIGGKIHEVKGVGRVELTKILQTANSRRAQGTWGGGYAALRRRRGADFGDPGRDRPACVAGLSGDHRTVPRDRGRPGAGARAWPSQGGGNPRAPGDAERCGLRDAPWLVAGGGERPTAKHEVLGLEGAKRGVKYPEWQVGDDGKPFAALPALFERLGGGPWAVYRFLNAAPRRTGGRTGLEALRQGDAAAVLDAAEGVAGGTFA